MVHHGFREMEENGIILHQGNEYIANRDRDRIIGDDAERPGDHGASCMVHHGFQEMEENGIILHQEPSDVGHPKWEHFVFPARIAAGVQHFHPDQMSNTIEAGSRYRVLHVLSFR
ncbi:uncharacterized protein LOC105700573 isoform X3 [Orussus abietinus]|nr:uncharacterized protein LOC105700573 isoform X3 [Orussus abietinus]